jgi:amino acid transporter, AAT family
VISAAGLNAPRYTCSAALSGPRTVPMQTETHNRNQLDAVRNEQVLSRQLTAPQQTMMALGGAIGTGLFLASGLAVNVAGPAIILSYVFVAFVSLLLGSALTEMAVAHPTAGSFGVYAGMYVSPFAGYAVRVSYWLMEVVATGGQLVAASIYMAYWFPTVPGAVWVLAFAIGLVFVNSRAVGQLGLVESALVLIKIMAVALFVVVAVVTIVGRSRTAGAAAAGLRNLTDVGGFMPFGAAGVWLGCCFVFYSFIGVEIVGVTSGEAADPSRSIPKAMRRLVVGLSAIYIATITLLVALTPWNQLGVGESPFVSVLRQVRVPGAAGLMNFVVLTAALSSANANLYLIVRTLFSLARAGFVPKSLGTVTERGTPLSALFVSSAGLAAAVLVQWWWPASAYVWFFGVALFGGLFVWLMIFVTHIAFRRRSIPIASCAGAAIMITILVSTGFVPALRSTLIAGGPWLLALAIGYRLSSFTAARRL